MAQGMTDDDRTALGALLARCGAPLVLDHLAHLLRVRATQMELQRAETEGREVTEDQVRLMGRAVWMLEMLADEKWAG